MQAKSSPDPKSSMWAWMAHDLRFHRAQRNLTGDAVAKILNCARSSISRLENAEAKLDDGQAAALDRAWRTGGHFSIQLWYAQRGHDPNWHQQHLDIEARSSVIKVFEALVVPGLLQTSEYAHALIAAGGVPNVDRLVEERMPRQVILTRDDPPVLLILLTESVLDWSIGGPAVMRNQLARLLEASELPDVGIRVVPRSAGAHYGLDGSFKIMSGPSGDVAYTESPGGGRLVPSADEVRSYLLRYDRIGQQALPEDQSRELIKRVMETMK
ncbi:helix-turn-helix transcriptional regulator [Actinoallomurus purpureus]|uniref:helix-turn-helix domain-containing protein n=1 Tax=Actinoallomurus purpureus TaxID=478114 RepID=UPI0020928479|nr:helix-turn-helix transcriptional regulator [Actinoallomurus purpureus]MCO6006653.1 helix-turn-helix transcriptional regulator [Actinoallomurus purpureus]